MTLQDFQQKAKGAAREFASRKKAPTRPETQFVKGAEWAWCELNSRGNALYYERILSQDVCDRYAIEQPELWMESLIRETAVMMADRDGMMEDIIEEGRLITKVDKNMNEYKESNPLYVHLKELQRSIGMQREHLGLSAKSAKKMEAARSKNDIQTSSLDEFIDGIKG